MISDPERFKRLQIEIDLRLLGLHAQVWEADGHTANLSPVEYAAHLAVVRAAYGMGYFDALREDARGERDALSLKTGYPVRV